MAFYKYSENLAGDFLALDKYPEQNKMASQKVEVLLSGIKKADTELIAYKAIISYNYAGDFTRACYHFLDQVERLHGGTQLEAQSYKQWISEVIHGGGGYGGGQGHGPWMRGGRDGAGRSRQDRRGGRRGGQSKTVINGVDVLDPTHNFTANGWNSLGCNGGRAYVA